MNKFNEKIRLLKEDVEEHESRYYELKTVYDGLHQTLNKKEAEVRALESRHQLLEDRYSKVTESHKEHSTSLAENKGRVQRLQKRIGELEHEVAEVEANYDELNVKTQGLQDELNDVNRVLEGGL